MLKLPSHKFASLKEFFQKHKTLATKYVVSQICKGVRENKERVELFQLGDTPVIAAVRKKDFQNTIKESMDYFVQEEMYEDAAKCRDLLREIESRKDREAVNAFLDNLKG